MGGGDNIINKCYLRGINCRFSIKLISDLLVSSSETSISEDNSKRLWGRDSLKNRNLTLFSADIDAKFVFIEAILLMKLSLHLESAGQKRIKCSSFSTSDKLQILQFLSDRGMLRDLPFSISKSNVPNLSLLRLDLRALPLRTFR